MIQENPRWYGKAALLQPELETLAAKWREWARTEPLPLRHQFDPVDFPRLLTWLVLAEIVPDAPDFDARIRYVGSEIVHYFDSAYLTGKLLSEFGPEYWRRWADVGQQVSDARAPQFFHGSPFMVGKAHVDFEMLALPLSKSGEAVDFVVLAFSRL